eukprot:146520_1
MANMIIVVSTLLTLSVNAQTAPFSPTDVATMRQYFEANINVNKSLCLCEPDKHCHPGFVVAAPTQDNPDYYYHWQRDAGVSMHVLQYTADSKSTIDWTDKFDNYVQWVVTVQTEKDPNNQNILGEPKFNCDGSVFSSGWCRPQNDGPASRAIAMIDFAFYLLNNSQQNYINQYLYKYKSDIMDDDFDYNYRQYDNEKDKQLNAKPVNCSAVKIPNDAKVDCGYNGINSTQCVNRGCCWYEIHDNPNNDPWCFFVNTTRPTPAPVPTPAPTQYHGIGTIVTDLNYVSSVWQQTNNCDLWEEINGVLQFYTLMVQRFALLYGASLATKLGDTATASKWTSTANSMTDDINSFNNNSIISEKQRTWDCSIILGALYGGTPNEFLPNAAVMYPPNDKDILNTASQTVNYFKTAFPLNVEDDQAGIPGTLLGRYKDDRYPGCDSNGGGQGHVWILCSNALAELYYRNSNYYYKQKENARDILSVELLKIILEIVEKDLPTASEYLRQYINIFDSLNNKELMEISAAIAGIFASQGDGQLTRVAKYVIPCKDHMSEQICEQTSSNGGGQEIGAHDLTWSYGTVLSAMYYRDIGINLGIQHWDNDINNRIDRVNLWGLQEDCGANICQGQCKD